MRESYIYPGAEEPYLEVIRAVELDNFYEKRVKKRMVETAIPLIQKYRPISFAEMVGNKLMVQKLAEVIKTPTHPHAFLLSGESGIGKSTIAYILAREFNAAATKLDAASNSSVDDTRKLVEMAGYKPITVEANRLYILEEAHNFSSKAFEPLLDLLEFPPVYCYFVLCTTEPEKIPKTIKTRCYEVPLKPLKLQEIEGLIQTVSDIEGWIVNNDVFAAICQAAQGSARKALSILQAGWSLQSRDELAQVVAEVEATDEPMIQLCAYLMKGGRAWIQISKYMERVEDYDAALTMACRYFTNALTRSQEAQAKDVYRLLRAFTDTYYGHDRKVQLYVSICKILFGEIPF